MRLQPLFLVFLALAVGCSSSTTPSSAPAPASPASAPPSTANSGTPSPDPSPAASPTPPTPAAAAAIPADLHQLDPSKHQPTRQAVVGKLFGQVFRPQHVLFNANRLVFRTGNELFADQELSLQLLTVPSANVLPLRTVIDPNKPNVGGELVLVSLSRRTTKDALPETIEYTGKFALTLDLAARQAGKVKGHIHLSLDDAQKTALAGTFEAIWQRPFGGPLDADEVPHFTAKFAVPPKTSLIDFGYIGDVPMLSDGLRCSLQFDLTKLKPGTRLGSGSGDLTGCGDIQAVYDQDSVTFDAGRLLPGRYLIWARIPDGPLTFEWLEVTPQTTATIELNFRGETGTVEIKTANKDAGKVTLTPTASTANSTEFTNSRYYSLRAEASIKDGQAKLSGLPPGPYRLEVWKPQGPSSWAGLSSQVITVKAGPQTIELKP